tara:strand:+ start:264 stop:455 length:192 start_codon:yes stop_codon:yes gene_type:complete
MYSFIKQTEVLSIILTTILTLGHTQKELLTGKTTTLNPIFIGFKAIVRPIKEDVKLFLNMLIK